MAPISGESRFQTDSRAGIHADGEVPHVAMSDEIRQITVPKRLGTTISESVRLRSLCQNFLHDTG